MTFIEAYNTGKPARRPVTYHKGSHGNAWLDLQYFWKHYKDHFNGKCEQDICPDQLSIHDICKDDWEVKNETIL